MRRNRGPKYTVPGSSSASIAFSRWTSSDPVSSMRDIEMLMAIAEVDVVGATPDYIDFAVNPLFRSWRTRSIRNTRRC